MADAPTRMVDEPLINTTIGGRFVLRETIGSGGMGKVFRADQKGVGRTVAVKIMHPHLLDDATALARFTNEARAASTLNHPNSIGILDFGQTDAGMLYIVMEYLGGRALDAVLREQFPLPLGRVAFVLSQVLDAVEAAHEQNIIHRDLKPENIFLLQQGAHRDFVKVLDFGIAKMLDLDDRSVTTPGLVPGTPEYMSPEQARGEKLDPRSDVYSLGVILYEMLTCSVPFKGSSAIATMMSHVQDPVEPPSARRPDLDIPAALDAIVTWALAKTKSDRISSAAQFRDVLSAWAQVAGVWPEEFDARASSPDILRDFFSADQLTEIPEDVSGEQRSVRVAESSRPTAGSLNVLFVNVIRCESLVGRRTETEKLAQFVAQNGPRSLRIEAEVGMGKSRLVDELVKMARDEGYQVFRCRPESGWTPIPLGAVLQTARQCLGLSDDQHRGEDILRRAAALGLDPSDVPGLKDLFSLPTHLAELELASRRRERATAFKHLVYKAAADAHILLIFENIERYDEPSRELITALANAPRGGMAVVVTHVPDPTQLWPSDVQLLRVQRLDSKAGSEIAQTMLRHTLDYDTAERIGETCQGQPLFVEQLAYAVAFEDVTDPPDRLPDLVAARVERLAKEDRYALQWLAVLNESATSATLSQIGKKPVTTAQLRDLTERGFLRTVDGTYTFSHHLMAVVVYSSIPAEVRREMHQATAEHYRQQESDAVYTIAYHAYQADDGPRAVQELDRAGMLSQRFLDQNGAISQYTQALDLIRREWGRGRVSAVELDQMAVNLALRLAGVLADIGHNQTAEGVLEEILSVAAADDEARARLRLALGRIDLERGSAQRAVRHLQLARSDARAASSDLLLGETSRELSHARASLGERDIAIQLLSESIEASNRNGPSWQALLKAAEICSQLDFQGKARGHLLDAFGRAEAQGSPIGKLRVLMKMAEVHQSSWEWDEAEMRVNQAMELVGQVGDRTRRAELLTALGRLRRVGGDPEAARSYLQESLKLARTIGWWEGIKQAEQEMELLRFAAPQPL